MKLTIGKLAARFGLSRSTLLYYDSIGLLSPSLHSKGEYRIYDQEDERRLERICRYRQAGIPLKQIKKILDSPETSLTSVLQQRFEDLGREVQRLHDQQRLIAELLQKPDLLSQSKGMNREVWSSLLRSSGYSELDMRRWHVHFERMDSEKHLVFLRYLGIPEDEIMHIRSWAEDYSDAFL